MSQIQFLLVLHVLKPMKMGQKSSLSEAQQAQIIIIHKEEYSTGLISEQVRHTKNAVHNAIMKNLKKVIQMPKGVIDLIKPHQWPIMSLGGQQFDLQ